MGDGIVTLKERKAREAERRRQAVAELREVLAAYAREHRGRYLLFGSAARGGMRYDSDVDILVDFPCEALNDAWNFAATVAVAAAFAALGVAGRGAAPSSPAAHSVAFSTFSRVPVSPFGRHRGTGLEQLAVTAAAGLAGDRSAAAVTRVCVTVFGAGMVTLLAFTVASPVLLDPARLLVLFALLVVVQLRPHRLLHHGQHALGIQLDESAVRADGGPAGAARDDRRPRGGGRPGPADPAQGVAQDSVQRRPGHGGGRRRAAGERRADGSGRSW